MALEDECKAVVEVGLGCIGGMGFKRSVELFDCAGTGGIGRATFFAAFEKGALVRESGLSAGILKYETSGSYLYITVRCL